MLGTRCISYRHEVGESFDEYWFLSHLSCQNTSTLPSSRKLHWLYCWWCVELIYGWRNSFGDDIFLCINNYKTNNKRHLRFGFHLTQNLSFVKYKSKNKNRRLSSIKLWESMVMKRDCMFVSKKLTLKLKLILVKSYNLSCNFSGKLSFPKS